MSQARTIWRVSLGFFIISAILGLLLRLLFFRPVAGLNYQYLLHTHSHIVLLGWVFNALMAGVHFMLFQNIAKKKFFILFLLFQLAVLGMMFTFPFQGYATLSIIFSTLHIILSYFWTVWVWRESKSLPKLVKKSLRAGLIYLAVSTIGPFSLGPIVALIGSGSDEYFMAIYFYLHFLYNGAFFFILFGLFFWLLHNMNESINIDTAQRFLWFMNIGCVLGVLLSALWMEPPIVIYIIGGMAGIAQLVGLGYFIKILKQIWPTFKLKIGNATKVVFCLVFLGFLLKVLLQAISAISSVATLAHEVRNYAIAYLHLVFLGVLSPFLFAWFNSVQLFPMSSVTRRFGLVLFWVGFIFTEIILVSQSQWGIGAYYYQFLFGFSVLLLVGVMLLAVGNLLFTKRQNKLN